MMVQTYYITWVHIQTHIHTYLPSATITSAYSRRFGCYPEVLNSKTVAKLQNHHKIGRYANAGTSYFVARFEVELFVYSNWSAHAI